MFSDAFPVKVVDDIVFEVDCSMMTVKAGADVDIGANPSSEEQEEALEEGATQVNNVVHSFRLQSTQFDKKSFLGYLKGYMKAVKGKLEPGRVEAFEKGAAAFAKKIVANFKDYEFYTGETMNPDGMVALLNYREDGVTPYFTFWKDGLKEIKLVFITNASMSHALESLVTALVPTSREDDALRTELVAHCNEILNSHIGHNHEPDLGHLSDLVKRQLLQSSPTGAASLKFTNLLSRLLDQPVLSRKHASILFLQSLASSSSRPATGFLPTLAPPPPTRIASSPSPVDAPVSRLPRGKSKADILREYRSKTGRPHLPEHLLLRDTLYLLQGISGKYVRFSIQDDPEVENKLVFMDDSKYVVSAPTKALIHRLSEVGYLYTRVETFVREREGASGVGMIEQSLCHHLQAQLTEYYRLIAILESQMSASSNRPPNDSGADLREEETGLTLRRLDVWINEWRLRMRMMSVCVEGARDAQGGALVNLIHGYTDNGDPFVSKPFFATLHKWLFSGELYDPFSEFFVAMDPALAHMQYVHPSSLAGGIGPLAGDGGFGGLGGDSDDISVERDGGLKLWEAKYQFQEDMLPMFVGEAFGKKIFSTGKSLNFIRYSCHDSDWVVTREKMSNTGGSLKYSDIAGLERSIDTAYQIASHRLFEVFIDKFKLLDHLLALKHYLMLGHGDFADQLMEALGPSLTRPANALFRHNLTATLETAIRSSNAQNDPPDVLRRLDARMLEYSMVDAPIDTVLDPDSMVKYLKLFNHLWQMKRIEGTLNVGWMRITGGARTFLRVPELEPQWHQIRIVMAEMIHFMRQMQAYCQLEVIECSWKILLDFLNKKEGDLDALIEAHRSYLDRMVKKVLLLSPKSGKQENILNQVKEVFSTILMFREATDNFYNYCLSESARRDAKLDAERGVYSGTEQAPDADALPRLVQQVKEYGSLFSERGQTIVHQLQTHPDLDCRFLGIRLSFSDFYRKKT
ncbi:Spc98 family-domain-containing protein [Mycena rosella]|uniref:Translationally-controlled tumor protein homolog n=1 Tax=Mycena rosella TaxID=1033263 RepID=A0AAD7GL59_MYCRO|nr:Spc98 family-domain-containing protein [Mycena rosella]